MNNRGNNNNNNNTNGRRGRSGRTNLTRRFAEAKWDEDIFWRTWPTAFDELSVARQRMLLAMLRLEMPHLNEQEILYMARFRAEQESEDALDQRDNARLMEHNRRVRPTMPFEQFGLRVGVEVGPDLPVDERVLGE
jgi:hypothetical protein